MTHDQQPTFHVRAFELLQKSRAVLNGERYPVLMAEMHIDGRRHVHTMLQVDGK